MYDNLKILAIFAKHSEGKANALEQTALSRTKQDKTYIYDVMDVN